MKLSFEDVRLIVVALEGASYQLARAPRFAHRHRGHDYAKLAINIDALLMGMNWSEVVFLGDIKASGVVAKFAIENLGLARDIEADELEEAIFNLLKELKGRRERMAKDRGHE